MLNAKMFFLFAIFGSVIYFVIFKYLNREGNPACQPKVKDPDDLRLLLKKVIATLEKHNVTYWLDYGTALGTYR